MELSTEFLSKTALPEKKAKIIYLLLQVGTGGKETRVQLLA